MSGAGKSSVLKMLEDVGYYCIDNLPVLLMPKLIELLREHQNGLDMVALGIDIRNGRNFQEIDTLLQEWRRDNLKVEVLFMEASDKELIKRYKETRRTHPLSQNGRLGDAIVKERGYLENIKKKSTYIIDTSQLLIRELKKEVTRIFVNNEEYKNLYITILTFGFKNGIPVDADLVFDVRFLPNPYYIEELKNLSGNDKEVRDFVMSNEKAGIFLTKLVDMVEFLIPNYIFEGKNQLVIGIGCTGGKHRSVTIGNKLYDVLHAKSEFGVQVEHRDIIRENIIKEG